MLKKSAKKITLTLADVQAAEQRIRQDIYLSPLAYSERLSRKTGCQLYLKLENLQMTGSFKERGALNKLLTLNNREKAAARKFGLIAASAGNHAQGVAHAAKKLGFSANIVMPINTALFKIRGTEDLGANVILQGGSFQESYLYALELAKKSQQVFIPAFDDPQVVAGQGTVALEMLRQVDDLDAVIVPVGGGGLIGGMALALKSLKPSIRVIGVESQTMTSMQQSLKLGRVQQVAFAPTIADGIAVARVGDLPFSLCQRYIDEIVTVDEEEIASAILKLLEYEKTLVEGAGAVAFAAVYHQHLTALHGLKVAVVLSGGNIDMTMLSKIIERGLVKDGRWAKLNLILPDKPGALAALAGLIAEQNANILQVYHDRSSTQTHLGEAEIEITLETKGAIHQQNILKVLQQKGFRTATGEQQ